LWFWPQISLQNISLIFSLLNGLLIFSGAGAVFYFIFNKIFKSQKWAFFSVGFLLFLPHIFYIFAKLFFKNIPFADLFIASRTAQLFWLQSGSDYLAAFFVYLIFWWLLDKDFNRTVLTGVLGSLAVMLRPQNFLIFLIVFLVLAFYKKWKKIGLVILSAVPFGLWQTWINWRVSGSVFSFGYDPAYNQAMAGLSSSVKIFSGENVLKIFYYINNYSPELFFPLIVIIIGLVVGAVYLWRLDKSAFFVFGLGGGFYLFALSFFETTFRNPRYFLPILPALLALSISLFLLIKKYIKKYVKTK